jgi:Uma2 family endonuclease
MNAPTTKRMTVPEFLAWAETQENGRYELFRGQIVAMAPERWEHVEAKQRAFRALDTAIARADITCQALIDGLAVAVDDDTSYLPDALVNCGEPGAPDSLVAPRPIIVAEVLSPSTRNLDKTVKVADYFRVPSIAHYLIIDLGRRHLLHYRRQQDGAIMVAIIKDGEIMCAPPGIAIDVASLFG